MARPYRRDTQESIKRRIKRGFGQGRGKDYQPWLRPIDVASKGMTSRAKGWKTGRVHNLFSSLESRYFYLLDWADRVTDIREQFPLPIDESLCIAEQLGIQHPSPFGNDISVMTTDFLINIGEVEFARTVKPSQELANERIIEKFAIEQRYWEMRGVDWKIITEKELPQTLIENIKYLHGKRDREVIQCLDDQQLHQLEARLGDSIEGNTSQPLASLARDCDEHFGLGRGVSLGAVRHLLARKVWCVDMDQLIEPNLPMRLRGRDALPDIAQ